MRSFASVAAVALSMSTGMCLMTLLLVPSTTGLLIRNAPPPPVPVDDFSDEFEAEVEKIYIDRAPDCIGCGEKRPVEMGTMLQGSEQCSCSVTAEETCSCTGKCSENNIVHVCEELLGPCTCSRSDQAICECNGYCHTKVDRKNACGDADGCMWMGQWCEAEVGAVWSAPREEA